MSGNATREGLRVFKSFRPDWRRNPVPSSLDALNNDTVVQETDVREDLPPELETALVRGMDYQQTSDSLLAEASALREQLETGTDDQKAAVRKEIAEIESKAAAYQKQSDQAILPASGIETTATLPAGAASNKENAPEIRAAAEKKEIPETRQLPVQEINSNGQQDEVYSMFEVISDQRKIAESIIEIDPVLPAGLVYRLQIAVFSKPVDPPTFKGIVPVSGFTIKGGNVKRYYAGMFRKARDASTLTVKQLGQGMHSTAVMNGEPVSLDRAPL